MSLSIDAILCLRFQIPDFRYLVRMTTCYACLFIVISPSVDGCCCNKEAHLLLDLPLLCDLLVFVLFCFRLCRCSFLVLLSSERHAMEDKDSNIRNLSPKERANVRYRPQRLPRDTCHRAASPQRSNPMVEIRFLASLVNRTSIYVVRVNFVMVFL